MHACFRISGIAIAVAAAAGCASIEQREPHRVVGHQAVRHGGASDAEAQYALGKYYLGENRAALALIAFTRAIEYDPRHAEAYNGRATALAGLGDLERAAQDLARAIELAPRSAHLLNNLGYVQIQRRDFVGAAESLRRAFDLEPRNPRVVANWRMLAASVSDDPALARSLKAPTERGGPGLADLPAPAATPAVVQSLSAALSGPVVNLEFPGTAIASPAPLPAPLSATSNVDFERRQPQPEPAPSTAVVTIAPSPTTDQAATPGGVARADVAPAQLSVVNLHAGPAAAGLPDTALAPVAVGPVVDVAAVVRAARIEVSNGNGVRGMAARIGKRLGGHDYRVTRITNAASFDHTRTRIYFRDGFQREALRLGRSLGAQPAVMLDNTISPRADLRLVIGRDLATGTSVAVDGATLELAALDAGDLASTVTR